MRRIVIAVLLLLLTFGSAGCGGQSGEGDRDKDGAQTTEGRDKVTVNSKEIQLQDEVLKADIKIPVLDGLQDQALEERINRDLENRIMAFKEEIGQAAQEYVKDMKENGFESDINLCEAHVSYAVPYNRDGLLSLSVTYYQFTGGAHGMTLMETLNLNTQTGEALSLKDFFKPGDDYQTIILEEIHRQMAADPDVYFPDATENLTALSENQPFYITDGHIVVYFGHYEIAPYSSGMPEFKVPVSVMP